MMESSYRLTEMVSSSVDVVSYEDVYAASPLQKLFGNELLYLLEKLETMPETVLCIDASGTIK